MNCFANFDITDSQRRRQDFNSKKQQQQISRTPPPKTGPAPLVTVWCSTGIPRLSIACAPTSLVYGLEIPIQTGATRQGFAATLDRLPDNSSGSVVTRLATGTIESITKHNHAADCRPQRLSGTYHWSFENLE